MGEIRAENCQRSTAAPEDVKEYEITCYSRPQSTKYSTDVQVFHSIPGIVGLAVTFSTSPCKLFSILHESRDKFPETTIKELIHLPFSFCQYFNNIFTKLGDWIVEKMRTTAAEAIKFSLTSVVRIFKLWNSLVLLELPLKEIKMIK
ncbi:uncharacterized protein LOC135169079 [Diachasmimorpha longicaudata]|uniref:uncharacterized protein LOC135169079 n=1 Tax=Diachasmimorpha longicaudata TaxID=58733 RepID=UPI0030B87724